MSEDKPQMATVVEIHAVVTVGRDDSPEKVLDEVSFMAWDFRNRLPRGSQFSIQTRDVPVQKPRTAQA